jgi:hypothetical protein
MKPWGCPSGKMPQFAKWAEFIGHGVDREIARHATIDVRAIDAGWR